MFLEASVVVTGGFVILPLIVASGFVAADAWAARRLGADRSAVRRRAMRVGAAVLAWLLITSLVAASGLLRRVDIAPPPLVLMVLAVGVIGIGVPFTRTGVRLIRGLPLWFLVGFQAFRLPLELVMHRAYVEGLMPVQMSYSGRNYDILTGITAALLGLRLMRGGAPRWVVSAWNFLGFALLLNVVTIAVLSTPVFRWFGDDRLNVFVTYPPFVWLPTVLVAAALMGHILLWRRLQEDGCVVSALGVDET